jgi:hypothetical protein
MASEENDSRASLVDAVLVQLERAATSAALVVVATLGLSRVIAHSVMPSAAAVVAVVVLGSERRRDGILPLLLLLSQQQ